MDRNNGQTIVAKPYLDNINWTRGIDQKTGKPLDYDPAKDIQTYAGAANQNAQQPLKKVCPSILGGNNFWPSAYSQRTKLIYIPALTGCSDVTFDASRHTKEKGWAGGDYAATQERYESNLTAMDPVSGEIKKNVHLPYPNYSGALTTAGGLVFLGLTDGTFAAYDDTTLEQLWKINIGSAFAAPPMTFAVNGKQYLAIVSGISRTAGPTKMLVNTPELKEQRHATVLYVFSL
jgi:alcohol dehydrogenase (cytochrome c)